MPRTSFAGRPCPGIFCLVIGLFLAVLPVRTWAEVDVGLRLPMHDFYIESTQGLGNVTLVNDLRVAAFASYRVNYLNADTGEQARVISRDLFTQLQRDAAVGIYRDSPGYQPGCPAPGSCKGLTPYGFQGRFNQLPGASLYSVSAVFRNVLEGADSYRLLSSGGDFSGDYIHLPAFSDVMAGPAVVVPLPTSVAQFSLALLALAAVRRRAR